MTKDELKAGLESLLQKGKDEKQFVEEMIADESYVWSETLPVIQYYVEVLQAAVDYVGLQ